MADDRDRIRSRSVQEERVVRPDGHDGNTMADGTTVRESRAYVADGGAVAAPGVNQGIGETAQIVPERHMLDWGSIWGGLLTGIAVFLVLELLAYAIGLLTTTSGGSVSASGAAPWVAGILSLVGFFVAGWVAGASARRRSNGSGLMNGLMVWALGVGLILAFSLLGLGSVFGALGNALGGILASGGTVGGTTTINGRQVAATSQAIALGAFFWLVLTAICAVVGGWLGSVGGSNDRLTMRLPGRLVDHQ